MTIASSVIWHYCSQRGFGMYETFNSHPKNVGELLSSNERAKIVVPQFQRGYSWEKKHVEAFWTDIATFQRESKVKDGPVKYFLVLLR